MNQSRPRLSIGMPVFNGEKHIKYAIDSILDQTYPDFELIILDNASTDKTKNICLEYETKDRRIHYYRNKTNIGAPKNYNRVFSLCSGEYFKWAAHDDVLAPQFLEKCVHILDSDSSIILCHSKVGRIDENGILVGDYDDWTLENIDSNKTHERFSDMIGSRNSCWTIMGVMRRAWLAKTPLHGCHINSDANLLAELSLMGRVYEIQEHLFFRRDYREAYSSIYNSRQPNNFHAPAHDYTIQLSWWGINKPSFLLRLPRWKIFVECYKSVNRVPLKFSEYLLCNIVITKWVFLKKKLLLLDLINEFNLWRFKLHYGLAKKSG